tara:strand:+ start:7238 stop:7885 length:648 start_codon:yes stop_codon:yes gene_type:complete
MKDYIYVFIFMPLISFSQIGVSISGNSYFTTGQTVLPLENGVFETVDYEMRNNGISLDWNTGRKLFIGEVWCMVGMTYSITKTIYNWSETNTNIADYDIVERRLIPSITFEYVFLRNGYMVLYSGIGGYAIFENLNLDQENNLDLNTLTHEYNGIIPFLRAGVKFNSGNFTINPFIGYELETIYFDELNNISSEDLDVSLDNARVRTGVSFGFLF